MRVCCMPGCNNTTINFNGTFHHFPKNENLMKVWLKVIGGDWKPPGRRSLMCSRHFEEDAIEHLPNGKIRLRTKSIPCRFLKGARKRAAPRNRSLDETIKKVALRLSEGKRRRRHSFGATVGSRSRTAAPTPGEDRLSPEPPDGCDEPSRDLDDRTVPDDTLKDLDDTVSSGIRSPYSCGEDEAPEVTASKEPELLQDTAAAEDEVKEETPACYAKDRVAPPEDGVSERVASKRDEGAVFVGPRFTRGVPFQLKNYKAYGIIVCREIVKRCCVPDCKTNADPAGPEAVPMYRFPREKTRRLAWIEAVRQLSGADWMPTVTSFVCLRHFREADLIWIHYRRTGNLWKPEPLRYPQVRGDSVPGFFEGLAVKKPPHVDAIGSTNEEESWHESHQEAEDFVP